MIADAAWRLANGYGGRQVELQDEGVQPHACRVEICMKPIDVKGLSHHC